LAGITAFCSEHGDSARDVRVLREDGLKFRFLDFPGQTRLLKVGRICSWKRMCRFVLLALQWSAGGLRPAKKGRQGDVAISFRADIVTGRRAISAAFTAGPGIPH